MQLNEADRDLVGGQKSGVAGSAPHAGWISLVDLLLEKRRTILFATVIGLVISAGVALYYPKYASRVQLMPPEGAPSGLASLALPSLSKAPGLAGLAGELLGAKNSSAVFLKVLDSRTVQDYLVDRFDLRKHYHQRYWEDAREKLQSHTTISEDKKSGVIAVTFEDRDPKFAAAVTGAYVEELDRVITKVATSAARRERQFIEQRLAEERQTLDDTQTQFSQFASSTMALDVPQQTKVTVESAAKLQGELIAARAQLEGMEQIYARENYRVKSLQAHIAELEKAMGKLNSATGNAQDPINPYPSVRSLPQLGVKWVDLYRNTKIHETVYELLTQQYELAKIQEAKEIPSVKLLDPPSQPEKRYPRPWSVLLMGAACSVLVSCLGVVVRDRWQNWSVADPRRALLARIYQVARGKAPAAIDGVEDHAEDDRPFRQRNGAKYDVPAQQPEQQEEYSERRR